MFAIKPTLVAMTWSLLALASGAQAVENGPTPTLADLQKDGPYPVTSQKVTSTAFGGGTIYSPNAAGKYALVAVCPGFVSPESSITDISRRLATHGFVVVTIATKTLLDFPASRATQLLAALKTAVATTTGPVVGKIDVTRQVVSGWSMGGGGTLEAAGATPGLKAAVAYAPWDLSTTKIKTITVPTVIFGATGDVIAPVASHAQKFYDAMPASTKKQLAVLQGSDHFFPNTALEPVSYSNIAWVKRFADGDTRYGQFLSVTDAAWSKVQSNGPF
jgi:dienelactone hydrolase